jgi:hypothetical protein
MIIITRYSTIVPAEHDGGAVVEWIYSLFAYCQLSVHACDRFQCWPPQLVSIPFSICEKSFNPSYMICI